MFTVDVKQQCNNNNSNNYFEFVLESLGKYPIAADIIMFGVIYGDFFIHIDNVMFCGLFIIDETILMR